MLVLVYDLLTGEVESHLSSAHKACVRDVAWHPQLPEICSSSVRSFNLIL